MKMVLLKMHLEVVDRQQSEPKKMPKLFPKLFVEIHNYPNDVHHAILAFQVRVYNVLWKI